MAKFKVGDKVRRINGDNHCPRSGYTVKDGEIGVVTAVHPKGWINLKFGDVRVENFSNDSKNFVLVEAADARKIVITTDGKTTTARLFNGKELVKKAEAKCSPGDKFDFMVGAELAMERLIDEKPVNPFKVGDFVKIKRNDNDFHCFPAGSVGRVIKANDDGTCEVDGFREDGTTIVQWVEIEELEKV